MRTTDVERIKKILRYRERDDLAELLQHSTSRVNESGTYGKYLFSTLSIFEIYSPIEDYEKLRNLSEKDRKEMLNAVLEIYPPKENSPEITDIRFYLDANSNLDESGLYAFCTECGTSQGIFTTIGELRKKIAEQKKCVKCGVELSFLRDGRIWNLEWEILPSREEYIISLLEKEIKEKPQIIFCYEDLGPQANQYRYPQKRIKCSVYEKTERASPAFAVNIFDKEDRSLEKSYCFDNPYALLQIAKEAIKGIYWLKYGKRRKG